MRSSVPDLINHAVCEQLFHPGGTGAIAGSGFEEDQDIHAVETAYHVPDETLSSNASRLPISDILRLSQGAKRRIGSQARIGKEQQS